jgi:4-amino-4-deoxy-L-arabinose transferase-like glycosyltransferase
VLLEQIFNKNIGVFLLNNDNKQHTHTKSELQINSNKCNDQNNLPAITSSTWINKKIPTTTVFIIPLLLAIFVRLIVFFQWFKSPFRYYHTVKGLDMMTLLNNAESFYQGHSIFSPYKSLIAILHLLVGQKFLVETLIATQMCIGVISIFIFTLLVLQLTGRKKLTITAAILMAIYAPLIVYETQILKASLYTFLALLSLYFLILAKKHNFKPLLSILAGFTAILPFLERFAGILWPLLGLTWLILVCFYKYFPSFKQKKIQLSSLILKILKPSALYICGIALAILTAVAINYHNGQSSKGYISINFSYLIKTGANKHADINGPQKEQIRPNSSYKNTNYSKKLPLITHYLKKLFNILNDYQTPNNINYYFIKRKLPSLQFLLGPALLIPFAIAGLIILIINGSFLKKESIIFFYATAFILPTLAFLPLARYKLILIPVMAFSAAYTLLYILKIRQSNYLTLKNTFFLIFPFLLLVFAMNTKYPAFREKTDLYAYSYAAVYIPTQLMEHGNFKKAEHILKQESIKTPNTPLITIFLSSSYMGQGRFKEAELLLKNETIPTRPNLQGRLFFNLAESLRFQYKYKEAEQYYKLTLKTPYGQQMKPQLQNLIKKIQVLIYNRSKHSTTN